MIKETKPVEPVLFPLLDTQAKLMVTEDTKKAKRPNLAPLPAIGTRAKRTRTITDADIVRFADVSGDHNPLHLNAAYAAQTLFGERVAHGMLTASMISAILGNDLPGPGTIYLGQTLKFLGAVHIGDTVTASVEVIGVREDKRLLTLRTDCINQDGAVVLTGEATVKYSKEAGAI
jgi:3-hydroxybutyryl-CoA dehydratase